MLFQTLEEAGAENSRFDMIVPTIVYPASSQEHTLTAEELGHLVRLHFTPQELSSKKSLN